MPRIIDINWGNQKKPVVLVGKGVCFDTGGLNIKPASGMGINEERYGGCCTCVRFGIYDRTQGADKT